MGEKNPILILARAARKFFLIPYRFLNKFIKKFARRVEKIEKIWEIGFLGFLKKKNEILFCLLLKSRRNFCKLLENFTVYFSDGDSFQDFSGFQKQHFQQAHFHNVYQTQEQVFPASFLEPSLQQDPL